MTVFRIALAAIVLMMATTASAATWTVSATLANLQIDHVPGSSPPRDRQVIGIVVSVADENGAPVKSLTKGAFEIRSQTCAPHPALSQQNTCRLGKPATIATLREMEVAGTYFVGSMDTYANAPDEVLSQGVVVLGVYQPGNPGSGQPAVLKTRLVLRR